MVAGISMIRWTEFCLDSLASGEGTRFGLVLHTEGLVSDKVAFELKEFGREVSPFFRPMLTTITPICPMYQVDPLADPLRVELPEIARTQRVEAEFAERINSLAEYFDVGYHGHFFKADDGVYRPTFELGAIRQQFEQEREYLSDIGLAPETYAGGWWYINSQIHSLMAEHGLTVDTTINDLRLDSFSRRQPFPESPLGQPFWVSKSVLEIPSLRSFFNLFFGVAIERRRSTNYVIISMHDYDLVAHALRRPVRRLVAKLLRVDRLASISEIAHRAASGHGGRDAIPAIAAL